MCVIYYQLQEDLYKGEYGISVSFLDQQEAFRFCMHVCRLFKSKTRGIGDVTRQTFFSTIKI